MAQLSNAAVYASMLVYALALFGFAASLAARRCRWRPRMPSWWVRPVHRTLKRLSPTSPVAAAATSRWRFPGLPRAADRRIRATRSGGRTFSLGQHVRVFTRRGHRGGPDLPDRIDPHRPALARRLGDRCGSAHPGRGVTLLYTESAQLVPALKSWWLVIHVSAAAISGGAFTLSAGLIGAYLVRQRAEDRGRADSGLASRLPSADRLDLLSYRTIAFVFPVWTFAVIAGAIWAENAWGRYWGWDPKETWAFITWVIYAGYLHARSTAGWKGRKAAIIGLVGFVSFLINYFGVNFFATGLHSYAGV